MPQETSFKFEEPKKRVKFAVGKSVKFSRDKDEKPGFKKNGFQGNGRGGKSRRVETDSLGDVDGGVYKRREDSGRRSNVKSKNNHVNGDGRRMGGEFRSRRGEDDDGFYVDDKMHKREDTEWGSRGGRRSDGVRSRRVEDDNRSYDDDKRHKREYRGKGSESNYRDRRARGVQGDEGEAFGQRGFNAVNSDRKRKRIYADNDINGESILRDNVNAPSRKGSSREQGDSEKKSWVSISKRRYSNENESTDGRRGRSFKAMGRRNGKVSVAEQDESRNDLQKKIGDGKYYSSKKLHQKLKSYGDDHESGKKKFQNKKGLADESVVTFDRPRRKRRLIRIEYPNDFTNKKLDDSEPKIDNTTVQTEDSDNDDDAEMSKNAQFRAIQPTPSILSFVQENLLGRRREIEFRKAGYNIELPVPLDNIPFSTSSERERIEEPVFRNKLAFFAAAKVSSSFPSPDLPEIAFAGRSNVGKSSLLNSLTRQWGIVRTSDKPGLTQTINFFNLGSKLCLVDLPGYGFAYAKDEVKESWEELVKEYVSTRTGLKRVCLLIDTKWGMKPRDHELIDLMERSKTKYQIVLTKTDLSFPIDVARRATQIEESLKTNKSVVQPLMMVSSKTGAGIRSLRTVLSNISRFARL